MSKRYVLPLIAALVVLTACSNGSDTSTENTDSAVAEATAVSATPVKEVVSENIVEEFEEESFNFKPANLVCVLPKGFKESEYEGEYYYRTYPKDVSSINQVIVESDENVTLKTKEEFIETVKEEFALAYGDNLDIEVTQYDKMMIDERPALVVMYNYTFKGDRYDVLTYMIYNGTETNYVTYMQGPGADWMDEFIESGSTIRMEDIE